MSDREIEYYVKNYEKWLESKQKLSSRFLWWKYYVYDGNASYELRKLEYKVKSFIQGIYKQKIFVKNVYKWKRWIWYTYWNKTRVIYPKKTYRKFIPSKLICNLNRTSRNVVLWYLQQIEKSFNNRWMYYLKFDISSYYPSLSKDLVIKVVKNLSKKFYWIVSNKANEIIKLIEKTKNILFVDWKSNLYLWLYVNKLLAELVSIYIAMKIDGRFILFFEDDFLVFYKKDARLDLFLQLKKIKNGLKWFFSYYNLVTNKFSLKKELWKFLRKLVRYFYKKLTWKNQFEVNAYLNNSVLQF